MLRYALTTNHSFFTILLENNEPAIRKCYRKERHIVTKSESIAKVYVIENEVFTGQMGQKNRGLPKYAGSSGLVLENKG